MERREPDLTTIGILAAIYFAAGKIGLSMAFVHPSSTAVWPPTGITLAAFLILGNRVWPGIWLGAFAVNLTTAGTILTSAGIATGNTLEGVIGAYLVTRFAGGSNSFHSAQDTFKFSFFAGIVSTTVSATFGVLSLTSGGAATWANFAAIWTTWWMGDAVSNVVVAPLLLLWFADHRIDWDWARLAEIGALLLGMSIVGEIVFAGLFLSHSINYPLEYLCIPFLIWAAFRFGQRDAATVTLVLSAIAIWGTFHGFGPFVRGTRNDSLLLLQSFMGVVAVMTIALAAVSEERRKAEEQARHLAVTDPLTGLANYRKLIEVLESEIRRYGRTERPFSVLLLDLDGLKSINDRFGHLVGSRSLVRLADVLRLYCRATDTAARYGGDEFAVIIPEASASAAQQVARRIQFRLSVDEDQPRLSVSIGTAAFPDDGNTMESLLGAADAALYRMKQQAHSGEHTLTPARESRD